VSTSASARSLGIPLGRFEPASSNSITDVGGVRVGHCTIIEDEQPGVHGALRTGVTAVWPREEPWEAGVYAGVSVINGHGELIGICQIHEYGLLRSPVMLTSSLSIGAVYDGTARWVAKHDAGQSRTNFMMPIVTEVSDNVLSDNRHFPITPQHVAEALESARSDRPAEGAVGAGTGTVCYDLKGGIGTASRVVEVDGNAWTIGVLVLTNYGDRANLTIGGVQVGPLLDVPLPTTSGDGSCIVVVATDAPLLPHQLTRVATRGGIGLTRSGAYVGQTSGEIALAFSTANVVPLRSGPTISVEAVADGFNPVFNPLFEATVEAAHEAVLNSLFSARTMTGRDGARVHGLPVDHVADLLRQHGAIA
jgi:D-aminopeptidase